MCGMSPQISAGLEELFIELQIYVMRLQVHDQKHGGHRAGKFAECIVHILGL